MRNVRNKPGRSRGVSLGPREQRRLVQLGICLLLFGVTLVGRGNLPVRMVELRHEVLSVIRTNTDFEAVFTSLGESVSRGEPAVAVLGGLWEGLTAFDGEKGVSEDGSAQVPVDSPAPMVSQAPVVSPAPEAPPEATPAPALSPPPETVDTGLPLPENCTAECLALELKETVTPVTGNWTSGFGYRDHPIDGENLFHYGLDVAAEQGTPVLAFADGVVDFIGESPAYGQYIQLRHEGNITTFYAHCRKLYARKGTVVSMGDRIAEVGETGKATGPHLHFELKIDGMRVDPTYYIDSL